MRNKALAVGLVALSLFVTVVYAAFQVQYRIEAYGDIRSLKLQVYADPSCTAVLSRIDWGHLSPGDSETIVCYIKSESTVNAVLSLSTDSWNPSAAIDFISLSWNREGYILKPGQVMDASLTLRVSASIAGVESFSFQIIIAGMEAPPS